MDPITTAIVAALPALATELVSSSVKDAYAGLKALITRRFGTTSAVAKSVSDLEANPKSKGRAMVLSEHVVQAKAEADTEIMKAVSTLVEALKNEKNSGTSGVNIHAAISGGIAGVVGAQNVSVGSVNVGGPRTSDED
jgi:hypothetical protein